MDEPCSALDPISTLAIEDLIGELKEQYTVVIVTHNMQQAARVSDQTAFFNLAAQGKPGRLIEIGTTEKIFSNPDQHGHRGLHHRPLRLIALTPPGRPVPPRTLTRTRSTRRDPDTSLRTRHPGGEVQLQGARCRRARPGAESTAD